MMEPAQGSISGWTDGWMEEEKVSNMEQLIVLLAASWLFCLWTVYHFWQEVTGRPDHRRRARMDENLVLTDTTSLARSHTSLGPHGRRVCAIVGLISALSILKKKKWNTEKTNEERKHVAAHILEWKNWAIICYFAVNISTLRLQPLRYYTR